MLSQNSFRLPADSIVTIAPREMRNPLERLRVSTGCKQGDSGEPGIGIVVFYDLKKSRLRIDSLDRGRPSCPVESRFGGWIGEPPGQIKR